MKKNVLIGTFSPLVYFLVCNIMRYTILAGEYNDKEKQILCASSLQFC